MTALDIRTLKKVTIRLAETEEMSKVLRSLVAKRIGFKEEEDFLAKEKSKLKGSKSFDDERRLIKLTMGEKLKDNLKLEIKLKGQRNRLKSKISGAFEVKSRPYRGIMRNINDAAKKARLESRLRLKKKEQFLTKKYGGGPLNSVGIAELSKVDQSRFGEARIFNLETKWKKEDAKDPAVVSDIDQELSLTDDERNLLKLGPKFCIMGQLSEEKFERELEMCIMKFKWDKMGEDIDQKKKDKQSESDKAIDCVIGEEGIQECKEYERLQEAKCRMIFNYENSTFDFGNRRTTDVKNNARVIFPKTLDFQTEANLQMLRIELMGAFKNYMEEKCDKRGGQKSNLGASEKRGLKSLKKRVEDGELVVLTTDKTGNFSVLGRDRYLEAGLSHTGGDKEVGLDSLKTAQREINGHVSMLIKIFKIGKNWSQGDRIRETMMGESMETCPVHLLYKDHKGWSPTKGGVPPTRQVAGGNRGVNLYLSEIVSDILEPMVGVVLGGHEVISTEDLVARVVDMNEALKNWTSTSWWEGVRHGGYIACGVCEPRGDYIWGREHPEYCRCEGRGVMDDWGEERWVTWTYLRTLRRLDWEQQMDWDGELDRVLDSTEVLSEDLQDFSTPMVAIGSDVVSMYPNLDVDLVVDMIGEEVKKSGVKWTNVDWLEAARYLALNWTEVECRSSPLRRILPYRRKNRGTRPGVTGAGPMGRERGDQEQWVFPTVTLTEGDKKELLASVIKIATQTMFQKHYYSFGGKKFNQKEGGPIGLRGTCAVARLIMQIFDGKWEAMLQKVGLTVHMMARYMDDCRTFLPPVRPGWRWVEGGRLQYCLRWENEDSDLTPTERTRRVVEKSMNEVESFLRFTTESSEDFEDGWLATLDTSLRVEPNNKVLFRYWEKPTNTNRVVQKRTAMGENLKIQILTPEVIRRLANTAEEVGDEDYAKIVDNFAQKLINSGYGVDQSRRIIVSGIKGWRTKIENCKRDGRKLRRTAKESEEQREREKLLGKSSWFRETNKKGEQEEEDHKRLFSKPGGRGRRKAKIGRTTQGAQVRTVLFVEQTEGGELAMRLRELLSRLEPLIGFKIKVVERCGKSLQSQFPLNNLWQGAKCGREECVTCEQEGAEELPDCSKRSVLYENACLECIPTAGKKGGPREQDINTEVPALYVGESSRSIMERSKEHWAGYVGAKEDNHILRHQQITHRGADPPKFVMRVVSHHRSALERQVSEAVRIRRRGGAGAVLNSKSEFNRCHIPRLRLEDEEETKKREEQLRREELEKEQQLDREQGAWELARTKVRDEERRKQLGAGGDNHPVGRRGTASKRLQEQGAQTPGRRKKARKFELIGEDWGMGSKDIREQLKEDNMAPQQEQEGAPYTPYHTLQPAPHNTPTPPLEGAGVLGEQQGTVTTVEIEGTNLLQEGESCTFNRRGVCKKHKVLGNKTSSKKKAWTKKKFGWGWATVTSVSYTCLVEDRSDYSTTNIGDREVSSLPGVDKWVSINPKDLENSRSLVGPQISAALEVEEWTGPND